MKTFHFLVTALLFAALVSCSPEKKNPLEKERKAFNKTIDENTALALYRGIKISIRSLPLNRNLSNLDSLLSVMESNQSESENVQKYTIHLIKRILDVNKGKTEISVKETLKLMKVYHKLKSELENIDEDTYPTMLEVLLYINRLKHTEYQDIIKYLKWNNSKEHLILAAVLIAAKPLPKSFQLYEVSKLKPEALESTEVKPVAAIFKGLTFAQNQWFYLSEEALTHGIYTLEHDKIVFEYKNYPALFENTKVDSYGAQVAQLHAISCLLRGYVRTKMDDEDKSELALEDFELFLKDAETIGMDNELVWFAGAYVYMKKEDNEKAISYLTRLHESEYFTDNEQKAIKEIKAYVSDRKPDKAMNVLYDKVFIGKLVSKYLYNYFVQIDWYKVVNNSETGKQLLSLPEVINAEYKSFEDEMSTDKLKEKGQDLINDIF